MKLSKNTWHYRRFEWWKEYSRSKRARKYRGWREEQRWIDDGHDEWLTPPIPVSLCPYFWIVMLRYPLLRMFAPVRDFYRDHDNAAPVTCVLVLIAIVSITGFVVGGLRWAWLAPTISIVAIVAALLFALGAALVADGIRDWNRNRKEAKRDIGPQPNIIKEFVKARKSKVCPILEFEE